MLLFFLYKNYYMLDIEINDIREQSAFRFISFSEFKKSDVKKELMSSLLKSKIEPACYWSAELICSGHYQDLWDIILGFYSKYIHIGNPKLSIYLDLRFNIFKDIIINGYVSNEIRLRNNNKIRKLFCELICILCESKRQHSFSDIKIKSEEFDLVSIKDKFKSSNQNYYEDIILDDDPTELTFVINEFMYNLSNDGKNVIEACYWIEWIMEFENICSQKKNALVCERRLYNVESKYQTNIIWLIWDIFLHESKKKNMLIQKIMKSILNLFIIRYNGNSYKKRKYMLYFAVSLLTENLILTDEILNNKQKDFILNITNKIELIYKQIKKNEISPSTDYLFKNIKSSNLEETIEKIDKLNSFEENFIPRYNI